MLFSGKSLARYSLEATDGSIGRIEDFYFDDESWVIRYLVVNANPWLPGEKKLLSPISVERIDPAEQTILVDLTKEQIKNTPPMDTERPVSRKQEVDFHRYFGYGLYWPGASGAGLWGGTPIARDLVNQDPFVEEGIEADMADTNPNLRSVREIIGEFSGYDVSALDEKVGHADNVLIKDGSWDIQYIVTDTRRLLPGEHHVISTRAVQDVNWVQNDIKLTMTEEEVKRSPKYDSDDITTTEENRFYDHYHTFHEA
ncbi:PRC-barrel domain-containing protein [Alteribacillus sp. YIM 98480]|uniref:PRC-barrel domain-containing protein n=1 Tax=Alteribacillus sp. YIM 98480 TaxID=2606599 RepID=UPI00131E9C4E|nr:PRC-barrel domain-containing protein [Alteribacillus sp. YIM 98480]